MEKKTDFSTIWMFISVENGNISSAQIASIGDNDLLTDDTRNAWAAQIVERQDVDAVSGVTVSSDAVREGLAELLARAGVTIAARAVRIGGETDPEKMKDAIAAARAEGDSVGGVVEATVKGLPVGVGDPMFGGMENRIAQAVFGIPAVKGIEFGEGFAAAELKGSENNDPYGIVDGEVMPLTNHAGGILGGLSTGAPLVFRVAFKPTPSIAKEQDSVDLSTRTPVKLVVKGRHDPCVVLRAVPCVEAAAAIALYDAILEWRKEPA